MTAAAAGLDAGLQDAVSELELSLRRVDDLANWLFNESTVAEPTRTRNETQQAGCTVLLVGIFESFLKSIVREYLRAVPQTGRAFVQLPEKMQSIHYEGGGRVLSDVIKRQRRRDAQIFEGITSEDLVARLYSPLNSSIDGYYLVWEAFADTKQSPRSEIVRDILQGLGFDSVWPSIESHASDPRLVIDLGDLIEKRNECAHTGRLTVVPTPSQILRYAEVVRKIGTAIAHLLSASLSQMAAA